jgi:hypothetical protein
MGKAIKSIGSVFGLGGGGGSGSGAGDPNQAFFDIEKEIAPAKDIQEELLQQQLAQTRTTSPQQAQVLEAMGKAALGQGPSLAETQLKAAQDRTLAQQLAATQAGRGGSAAASQRALMQAMTTQGRGLAQDSAEARLKEREQFMGAAGQQAAQTRADLAGSVDLATMAKREKQQAELARAQADLARTQGRKGRQSQLLGGLLGAGAAIMSDEDAKKNIKKVDKDMVDFLDKLEAKTYDYKDPEAPGQSEGKKYGVLAQALEKSKVGKTMVQDTPEGKMVNIMDGFGAVLASQAELNKRLKAMEEKKKKKEKA